MMPWKPAPIREYVFLRPDVIFSSMLGSQFEFWQIPKCTVWSTVRTSSPYRVMEGVSGVL